MKSVVCIVFGFLMLAASSASADIADYDPNSEDWTGLSRMVQVASKLGTPVQVSDTLDFRNLSPDQPIIIVYPQQMLDVPNLTRFIVNGGRVLLADDFGMSEDLLERLEIQRVIPDVRNLPHADYVNNNPALPRLTARGRHALLEGVRHVVANHPGVITNVGGPVLAYDSGGGLVYDMNLGEGKAIVISDASVFINQMLEQADNEAFLANAVRYICRERPDCRPILVTRKFDQVGTFSDSPFDLGDVGSFDAVNAAIASFLDSLPADEFLYWMSLLLVLGLGVYVASVFPIRTTRPYSAYVTDFLDSVPAPQSEFDWNVARFGQGSRSMNHALPMAILKENFEELFLGALGHWSHTRDNRPDVGRLADEFVTRYLPGASADEAQRARQEIVQLLGTLAQIPPRSRVFLDGDANISEGDLLECHRRALHVLKIMGLQDEYQRRTRGAI